MNSIHLRIVGCLLLLLPGSVVAQSVPLCHPTEQKDLSERVLLIKCAEPDVSRLTLSSTQQSLLENAEPQGTQITIAGASAVPGAPQWLMITLAPPTGVDYRSPNNNYRLVLRLSSPSQPTVIGETRIDLQDIAASVSATLCSPKDYKILSESVIGVRCTEADVSGLSLVSGTVFSLETSDFGKKPIDLVSASPIPDTLQWLLVKLAPSATSTDKKLLESQHKYRLALQLRSSSLPVKLGKAELDLDTTGRLSVIAPLSENESSTYTFESHVGFKSGPDGKCELTMQDYAAKTVNVNGNCSLLRPVIYPLAPRLLEDLGSVGRLRITLEDVPTISSLFPLRIPGLLNVYQLAPKFDSKSQLASGQAPATKDTSSYYLKFDHAAGKHATPAWVLEGRIAPAVGSLHAGFQFYPIAAADVGQSKVSGITYTDTVDFGASFTRVFRPNSFLQGLLFTPAMTFETDKEFDRDNVIANPDLKYYFAGLYAPRRMRTLKEFSKRQAIAKTNGITLSTDNIPRAAFGYSLDFHTGTEIGGALRDTTVTASVGKATQLLPSYSIGRIVPQIHGQLEVGNFTLDATGTPRYLALTENTVIEHTDHTLQLKAVSGWNAYGVISGSYTLDDAGHFSLNIAYKNGFAPPRFIRVNTVQTGIVLKY